MISFTKELAQKIVIPKIISVKAGAKFPREKLIATVEIKNRTFSNIALKIATNTLTLTILK